LVGIILILAWGPAEAGKSLYLPLILKNECTNFTFLAFGDSITTGYGSVIPPNDWYSIPHSGYVGRLYDDLHSLFPRQDISFYNMGKGGETTDSGSVRFGPTISQLACYTASGCKYPVGHAEVLPTLILIMEGTNDLNISNPFDTIDLNLRAMVSTALLYDYKVMIATIPPVCNSLITLNGDSFFSQIESFNSQRITKIASDYQIPLVDVFAYFLSNREWESQLMYSDCEHPNDAGYEVIKQAFLDQIKTRMTPNGCYISP